ncbi:MAG: sulfatase [Planctomycetota bacterium]
MLLLCVTGAFVSAQAAAEAPPNFVFFLVDDLGWGAMSAYGSSLHETPAFDQLCRRGMRFTNAYAACTVCSPSRAAILTGQAPARLRLTDWIPGHPSKNAPLAVPDWEQQMAAGQTTLPEALGAHGYQTWFLGKWHLMPLYRKWSAEQRRAARGLHTPEAHGFGVNIGGREWGQPKGKGRFFSPFGMPGLEEAPAGEYLTDRLTDEAIRLLESRSAEPFLLYLSYYTVHTPLMAKPEDVAYFLEKQGDEPGPEAQKRAVYAAMHKSLDESVGRIVAKLEALGLTENTVVVFTGDNGGDRHDACGGLRGRKATAFEGGTRVPTCVVWPGEVEPGSVCEEPIIGMDFYPTMLEAAGLPPMPEQCLDGESLAPLLSGGGLGERALYWHYPHYHRTTPYGAVRDGDWKLIEFYEDERSLLFNLSDDPAEQTDLAAAEPDVAARLRRSLGSWRTSVGAQMPTPVRE